MPSWYQPNERIVMTTGPTNDPANEQTAEGDEDTEGHVYVQEPGAPGSKGR